MDPQKMTEAETPDIKALIGRMLNKHYAMAADEHRVSASNSSIKRHYDESNQAENAVYAAVETLQADLSSALAQLRQAREDNETMRRALEDARAGFIDLAKTLEQYRKRASGDVALAYACDVGRALTTTAPKEKP